jgi:hypothetical protein
MFVALPAFRDGLCERCSGDHGPVVLYPPALEDEEVTDREEIPGRNRERKSEKMEAIEEAGKEDYPTRSCRP